MLWILETIGKNRNIINLPSMVSTYIPPFSKGGLLDLLSLWEERNTRTKLQGLPFDTFVKKTRDYSNFLIRMALLTPPKPAEIERPSLTSFFLAWLGT